MFSPEILKGMIKPLLIRLITDGGRMYGYQITQRARELSGGKLQITEGALYPALHKLEKEGILRTDTETIGHRERKYYSIAPSGAKKAAEKLEEVSESLGVMTELFGLKPIPYAAK